MAGKDFVELMTTELIEEPAVSLEGLCDLLVDLNPQAEMSPQALHQRINPHAVTYLQEVVQLALRQQLEPVCNRLPLGALAPFGRVLLEDSTQCRLHEKLAATFKGSGGSASPAAVKIDLIYDVLHHSLLEMHLSDGTAADQGRALAIIPHLRSDDLVLRDLGYLSLESLRQIEAQDAWYLSRLSKGVDVYLEADAQAPALVFIEHLERYYPDDHVIDLPVYIGHERVPCRLLAYRLPNPVVQERRRKALEEARKQGRQLSPESLDWLSFGLYITHVSPQVWPPNGVGTIYRWRWHVELTLRNWPSLLHIHVLKGTRPERITCIIYGRLITILMLDVHFISSLPVVQRTVCKAWAETRPVHIAWAESSTMPAQDVVDDAVACMASLARRGDLSTSNDTDGRDGCWRPRDSHTGGCQNRGPHRHRLV